MWRFRFVGSLAPTLTMLALSPVIAGLHPNETLAQVTAAMTSFRHSGGAKPVASLDMIGLYDQLDSYKQWWTETARCSGVPDYVLRPASVQFFYINARDFQPTPTSQPGRMVYAVTYAREAQIFVSILRARSEKTIKHEMLHQILYWWNEPGWHDDSRPEFKHCSLDISAPEP